MKKIICYVLAMLLVVISLPLNVLTFASSTPDDVIIIDDENGESVGIAYSVDDLAKVGSRSLKTDMNNTAVAYRGFWGAPALSKDISAVTSDGTSGALRFWVYIDDITKLNEAKEREYIVGNDAKASYVTLGSGSSDTQDFYGWSNWLQQVTKSGWNEVVLKFTDAVKGGTPNTAAIKVLYIRFPTSTSNRTLYLDDIKVSANTEHTVLPDDVLLVDDEAEHAGIAYSNETCSKFGLKSLKSDMDGTTIAYRGMWGKPALSKDISVVTSNGTSGALRFWVYIKDEAKLEAAMEKDIAAGNSVSASYITIGSGSSDTVDSYSWANWLQQVTKVGWNEVILDFKDAKILGNPNPAEINLLFMRFPTSAARTTVFIDDIKVTADTESRRSVNLPIVATGSGTGKTKTLGGKIMSTDASFIDDPYFKVSIYLAKTNDVEAAVNGLGTIVFELSSSGTRNDSEKQYSQSLNYLKPGWNTVYMPLSQMTNTGTLDISSINYYRAEFNKNVSDDVTLKLKDAAIIQHDDVPEYWFMVNTSTSGSGTKNVTKEWHTPALDVSNFANPHLMVSIYIARNDDPSSIQGLLKDGYIEITSSGRIDRGELNWKLTNYDIKPGWNTLCLPFSAGSKSTNDVNYQFDVSKINAFRVYTNSVDTSVQYTLGVKDIHIIDRSNKFVFDSIYSNNMLFQQNEKVVISGSGRTYDVVDAVITNQAGEILQTTQTTVDIDGRFEVSFDGYEGGYEEYTITFSTGDEVLATLEGIVFGELWLASGQSNMEYKLADTSSSSEVLNNLTDDYIRILNIPGYSGDFPYAPLDVINGAAWGKGTQAISVSGCSAVGYYHAVELREQLDMPVGIINANKGATSIYAWLSREAIESNETVLANAKAKGWYVSEEKWNIHGSQYLQMSAMYNTKIAPLANLSIAGMIWYQGCANVDDNTGHYAAALELLLESYSKLFGFEDSSMPLVVSHLHPYNFNNTNAAKFNDEISAFAANHPQNVSQIANYDLPLEYKADNFPIHPMDKEEIGKRMGIAAAGMVYGKNNTYTSPSYESAIAEDGAMIVKFKNLGTSILAAKNGLAVDGFAIAGDDGVYMPAKAEIISEDTVKVWNNSITKPVAVSYAYTAINNNANLVSVDQNGDVIFAIVPFISTDIDGQQLYRTSYWLSSETLKQWRFADGGANWYDIWATDSEATTIALDVANKTDGASSIKIAYTSSAFSIKPNVCTPSGAQFEDIETSLNKYGSLIFDIKTSNEITLNITANKTYKIVASDKWQRISIDLSDVVDMSELLFAFNSTSTSGEVYIDNLLLLAVNQAGDVNNDTNINADDLTLLRKILLGVVSDRGVTDINKDGYTNIIDLIRMRKILACL